jgi:restriction system protein
MKFEAFDAEVKNQKLRVLADQRRHDDQKKLSKVYKQVGDFHDGIYDTWGHVSPWSKSACNVDSPVMVVAQDWISEESIKKLPSNFELGYSPELPTNKNLQSFLRDFFGLDFSDIYATNLFVFVKPGGLSAHIPSKDLIYSAKTYTLQEIEIVKPRIVICLGAAAYNSLCKAIGVLNPIFKTSELNPVCFRGVLIYGVPHTGGLGTKNAGGLSNVRAIWSKLASQLK